MIKIKNIIGKTELTIDVIRWQNQLAKK